MRERDGRQGTGRQGKAIREGGRSKGVRGGGREERGAGREGRGEWIREERERGLTDVWQEPGLFPHHCRSCRISYTITSWNLYSSLLLGSA